MYLAIAAAAIAGITAVLVSDVLSVSPQQEVSPPLA